MKRIIEKVLAWMKVRVPAAGLEVSDQVIRLVYFDGKVWRMHAIRLEPGVLEKGKIKKRVELMETLAALKTMMQGKKKRATVNVVVCLSSVETYTQVFSLPSLKDEGMEQAVDLNLKMAASPFPAGEAYSGWQLIGRDEGTLQSQILSAFIDRQVVDDIVGALFEAGFLTMAVESRALALARMLHAKGAGLGAKQPYVFVSIDNAGIGFLIIRGGALYFEYTEPWSDIMDEKGEISIARFEERFTASVRQVINFYSQHWSEPLGIIVLSAVALAEQAERAIAAATSVPVVRLTLMMGQAIAPEWLTAWGCSLRGDGLASGNHEISLLGEESQDRFRNERLLAFLSFWRVAVPAVFCLLLLTFAVADVFLVNVKASIEARSDFNIGASQAAVVPALQASAADFNRSVALIAAAEQSMEPKSVILGKLFNHATANHVTLNHVSFTSPGAPIAISGSGGSQDNVIAFKTTLEGDSSFNSVLLPLTSLQTSGNSVSFSMTFNYTPPAH